MKFNTIDNKNSQKTRGREKLLNLVKDSCEKPTVKIILHGEILNIFPLSLGTKPGFPLFPLLLRLHLSSIALSQCNKER